jgi:predicted permease
MPPQNVQYYQLVSPGYFGATGIRLVEGRLLDPRDVADAPRVAVVNETMARTFWGGRIAIGARVRPGGFQQWYTIVGVVADVKNGGVETPTGTELYLPIDQVWGEDEGSLRHMYVVARSRAPHASVVASVRRAVGELDPSLPVARVRTLEAVLTAARSRPRFLATLLSVFSVAALFLAAVGLYGVVSYAVAQRTREFGVRLALGALPSQVLQTVLRRAALLTAGGLACGLAGAAALTRLLEGLLFNVPSSDPATFVAVSLLLGTIAMLASYAAARRATRIDPMTALRDE